MSQFLLKTLISALVIAGASELARRSSVLGALLVSLPLTSLLAIVWLWHDGATSTQIADFSTSILWLVLPSLLLFIVLPLLLRAGFGFWISLGGACAACMLGYGLGVWVLRLAERG